MCDRAHALILLLSSVRGKNPKCQKNVLLSELYETFGNFAEKATMSKHNYRYQKL